MFAKLYRECSGVKLFKIHNEWKRNEMFFFVENYVGNSSQVHENRHPKKLMLNNINKFSISEDDAYDISGIVHLESIVGKTRGKTRKKKGKKRKKAN